MIPNGVKKVTLNYMDTGSYYPLTETDDVYKDISEDIEKLLDTSNYDERRRKIPFYAKKTKVLWSCVKY